MRRVFYFSQVLSQLHRTLHNNVHIFSYLKIYSVYIFPFIYVHGLSLVYSPGNGFTSFTYVHVLSWTYIFFCLCAFSSMDFTSFILCACPFTDSHFVSFAYISFYGFIPSFTRFNVIVRIHIFFHLYSSPFMDLYLFLPVYI